MSPQKPFDVLLDDVIDVDIQVWQEDHQEPEQIEFQMLELANDEDYIDPWRSK